MKQSSTDTGNDFVTHDAPNKLPKKKTFDIFELTGLILAGFVCRSGWVSVRPDQESYRIHR